MARACDHDPALGVCFVRERRATPPRASSGAATPVSGDATSVRTIHPPPRGQRCLPATFQPFTTHAKAHRQPPVLACCNCTYREQDDGACQEGPEADRCFSNSRFTLRYATHVDHHWFPPTQEPAGVREIGALSKAPPHSDHPCILATVRRTQPLPFHFFRHDPGASARPLPHGPRNGARRFCSRRRVCAMDGRLGE